MVIALFAGIVSAGIMFAVYLVYLIRRTKSNRKSKDDEPFLGI